MVRIVRSAALHVLSAVFLALGLGAAPTDPLLGKIALGVAACAFLPAWVPPTAPPFDAAPGPPAADQRGDEA